MEKEKLLSIIVPVYNVEKYLKRCMDSILNQTYKELEIILVDDGSQDNSGHICDEYAALDRRVRVIHKKNSGASSARNIGVNVAKGEYLAFVDSDDWLELSMYAELIYLIEKYDLDIAGCGAVEINGEKKKYIMPGNKCVNHIFYNDAVAEQYFHGFLYVVIWNKVYKREIVDGIISPESYHNEDNYVSGRYLFRAKRMMMINKALYHYWINQDGVSRSINNRPLDLSICTKMLINDLERNGELINKFLGKLNTKMATGLYHFIRDNTVYYRVKSISIDSIKYMNKYLNLRRKISLKLLILKRNIKLY